jgi:hypothetical protein
MGALVQLSGISIGEALPVLLSILGSAAFVGLVLCVRRFDSEQGTDDHGNGGRGGGGPGPRPDRPVGPLAVIDPPLGEIRASRTRERVSS